MLNHVGYLLLGLGNGAVFAALAIALVVTYRSSGVINFATGSIALYTAYIYGFLREGKFMLLIPGLPNTVDIGFTPGFWLALPMALVVAALFGLLLYAVVFRPLRYAPPVARCVASIGVELVIVLAIVKRLGTRPLVIPTVFPKSTFKVGDIAIQYDRLYLALTIVGVALLLGAVFRYTRFGLVTRAAAETEKGAVVRRINPGRVAALNWMLSSAVAGLAGILISPLVSLVPTSYALFIVPALAAAVLGQFDLLLPAVVGGFVIGMLQSEAVFLQSKYDWFPASGVPELIPLAMILVVLVARAKPLRARGALIQRTLGRAPRPRRLLPSTLIPFALTAVLLVVLPGQWRQSLILSLVLAIVSLSWVVITGYCGQISLAQLTLAATAAYALSMIGPSWGIPFPIAPIMAALVATGIGVVVGLPALRVRGLTVAVVTLSLAVTLDALWFRNTDIIGSATGVRVDDPSLFGLEFGWGKGKVSHIPFGIFALVVLTLVALGVAVLRRSRLGSAMVAVRANERSAAAAGVDVVRVKVLAFAISSFIAGIGGTMLAYRYGAASYEQFAPLVGLSMFATVYLAGITSVSGGIVAGVIGLGGIVYRVFDQWIDVGSWYALISAVLLIFTVIMNPEGIVGENHRTADKLAAKRRAKRLARHPESPAPPPPVPSREKPALEGRPAVLTIDDVTVSYGGVIAVSHVSFVVPEGAIVGLIGPNGAGKTTLVDAITGFTAHTGSVRFGDRDLSGLKPHARVEFGVARTFQAIELYDDLSVQENLEVGLASGRQGFGASARASLDSALAILGITDLRESPAGDLSQGQRQLVSIGRALVAQPEVLVLDEPAAGLDSGESEWLGDRLRGIHESGVTILMVDHDVNLVLGLCDVIVVLDFGNLIASGTPDQIRADPRVIEAYLGTMHSGAKA